MPHVALKLLPGVDQNKTEALNEAALSRSERIRFLPDRNGMGLPQKLGGWERFYAQPMASDVKALWAWENSNSEKHLAVGMTDGLGVITDDVFTDLSPSFYEYDTTVDFSTVDKSSLVDIIDVGSNVQNTDSVFIMTHIAVDGLVLFGLYSCDANTADRYTITAQNVIGNPVKATSTVANGGTVASFQTVAGTPGVTVTLNNHGYTEGSNYPLLIPITVGGLTLTAGNYTILRVIDENKFTLLGNETPSSNDTQLLNGGKVRFRYYIGPMVPSVSGGYGSGGYGRGGYGSGITTGKGRTFVTTAASGVGTIGTLSFANNILIPVGSRIDVTGVTPTGFNGNWVVSASTAGATSTVSFDAGAAIAGPQTVAGSIIVTDFAFSPVTDWTLDNLGDNLIACPEDGAIYRWSNLDGGQEATIVENCPTNNHGAIAAMPQRQIIAYGSTFNDIQDPLLVRWNDINDMDDWLANATNQAGSFRLSSGSEIVGAVQGNGQILLWTDLGVWSMQYVSLPLVYSFNELGRGCGLIAKKAAIAGFGAVYWMSQTQFWKMDGSGMASIMCPVWDVVFQDIDPDNYANIRAGVNARFNEVWWFYPTIGSEGVPTKYVKYNTAIGQWDYGTLDRTAWIDQSVQGPPIASGSNRYLYQHEIGFDDDGQPMTSSFRTGYFALSEGDELTFLDQLWPDMKWGLYGQPASASVQITFYVAEYPGEDPRVYGPFTVTKDKKFITPRFRARLVAIEVSSSDFGSFWRLGNVRYRMQPDGRFL